MGSTIDGTATELDEITDQLTLNEHQNKYLATRWRGQALWMASRATKSKRSYYLTRTTAVVAAALFPAVQVANGKVWDGTGLVLSLTVILATALEELFRFGDRWRHYRSSVERLKIEGWRFAGLSGPYAEYKDDNTAYPVFVDRIEALLEGEVDTYWESAGPKGGGGVGHVTPTTT
jgi:Protein of unknown function (DUF4231)